MKITRKNANRQNTSRSSCPIAATLDVIGDKWSLLIIRDMLLLNKHEYSEFLQGSEGIATNILAARLKKLQTLGIINVLTPATGKTRKLYYLTPSGKDLLSLLIPMIVWGGTHIPPIGMPQEKFLFVKNQSKKFAAAIRKQLTAWEEANLS